MNDKIKGMNKASLEDYRSQLTAWMTELNHHIANCGDYITTTEWKAMDAKVAVWNLELSAVVDRINWFREEEAKVTKAQDKKNAESQTADLMKKYKIEAVPVKKPRVTKPKVKK